MRLSTPQKQQQTYNFQIEEDKWDISSSALDEGDTEPVRRFLLKRDNDCPFIIPVCFKYLKGKRFYQHVLIW